jgi:hypothetical protein
MRVTYMCLSLADLRFKSGAQSAAQADDHYIPA